MSSNTQDNFERARAPNTTSTGTTGYESSPLSQQQYGQGTTTTSSRLGEEGTEGGQKQYGQGGTGVGHHKSHQEGHLHGHGSGDAAKATCELDQTAGVGGGDKRTTTDPSLRPAEQTTQAYSGAAGDDPLAGSTTFGDTTGRHGTTATDFGSGTDTTTTGQGHHHKHHLAGGHGQEATGTGVKPSMTDKIVGGAEKFAGKVTSNTGMYQKGEERAAGETAKKNY